MLGEACKMANSAAPPDNHPSELALTADDAADQIRSISQMSLDAVERVRLVREVVLRTVSDQRPISPAVADSALRQLADPRLSTNDVLSVSKEIIDVTLTPRKVAGSRRASQGGQRENRTSRRRIGTKIVSKKSFL